MTRHIGGFVVVAEPRLGPWPHRDRLAGQGGLGGFMHGGEWPVRGRRAAKKNSMILVEAAIVESPTVDRSSLKSDWIKA